MRSTFPMRVAKIGYIIMSSMLCLLGIILIIAPDFSISLLGILCGSIFVVFGVIR